MSEPDTTDPAASHSIRGQVDMRLWEGSQGRNRRSRQRRAKDREQACSLWEQIETLLPDERQQRVAYLLFHCGLTPVEIVRFCPQEFQDIQEVSQLRYAVMTRLHKNLSI